MHYSVDTWHDQCPECESAYWQLRNLLGCLYRCFGLSAGCSWLDTWTSDAFIKGSDLVKSTNKVLRLHSQSLNWIAENRGNLPNICLIDFKGFLDAFSCISSVSAFPRWLCTELVLHVTTNLTSGKYQSKLFKYLRNICHNVLQWSAFLCFQEGQITAFSTADCIPEVHLTMSTLSFRC